LLLDWIRFGRRRCGKLRSFFSTRDCSQTIPSRGAARALRERLCLVVADADLSVANSSPSGHSNQCIVLAGFWLKPPHPGSAASWLKGEGSRVALSCSDRTTADESFLVWLLCFCAKLQATWAEDRALRGRNPSAVPGAKIGERAATRRPLSLSEIGINAINPGGWDGAPGAMQF